MWDLGCVFSLVIGFLDFFHWFMELFTTVLGKSAVFGKDFIHRDRARCSLLLDFYFSEK